MAQGLVCRRSGSRKCLDAALTGHRNRKGRAPGLGYRGRDLSRRTPKLGGRGEGQRSQGCLAEGGEEGDPEGCGPQGWGPGSGPGGRSSWGRKGGLLAAPWGFPGGSDSSRNNCREPQEILTWGRLYPPPYTPVALTFQHSFISVPMNALPTTVPAQSRVRTCQMDVWVGR